MSLRRDRNAKIVATVGPACAEKESLRRLFLAGVDMFRLNFSHGTADDHRARFAMLRELEEEYGRPVAILADLQGPKLRVGSFAGGFIHLAVGQSFRLDLDATPGTEQRAGMPHPEIFAALTPGSQLLLDDGKLRLRVEQCGSTFADTRVLVGGKLSANKGVNVPDVLLPLTALTAKDRRDLDVALALGADWIALSFVQRPEDVLEARAIVGNRAAIMSKLEKPAAIDCLQAIIAVSDAVMVARGDLGVEMPAERVPSMQKRIIRECRQQGKPVVVATQMLESMVESPVATRAEASDVATAIYDGADAVMLSAESASGKFPLEAVSMMSRIIEQVEADPTYRQILNASHPDPTLEQSGIAHAICGAMRCAVATLHAAAIVCYTRSGRTSLHAARERPECPVLCVTPIEATARRLAVVWGVHSVRIEGVHSVDEMTDLACQIARREGFAEPGQHIIAIAGIPFGAATTTNLMRIATV